MKTKIQRVVLLTAACLLAGCGGSSDHVLWDKIHDLQSQKNELETRSEKLETENRQLIEQCHALDSIDRDIRLSALDRLDRIEIGKYSGLTDENKDGRYDTLTVHLEPIDQTEDIIKAPGQVKVSLWHLDPSAKEYLLDEWTVTAEQLKTLWGHSLFSRYYRLQFPLPEKVRGITADLTVKVTFTDYFTGKTVTAQKAIGPL